MGKTPKWLKKELIRRGAKLVLGMDETVMSYRIIRYKDKNGNMKGGKRRYYGKKEDGEKYAKTYQVCVELLELDNHTWIYNGSGLIREHSKYMKKLKEKDIKSFVEAIRDKYGPEIPLYADNRPLTRLVSEKYPNLKLTIRSKRVTRRIDSIFGCKNKVYQLKNGKEIRNFEDLNLKYAEMWDKLGLAQI